MTDTYVHHVQIYYEDTDHSGLVYHPNYLKYFERAREHMLGTEELVQLWDRDGIGFVVYKAEMNFKEGARFGDRLEIRTKAWLESDYRIAFDQQVWRVGGTSALVTSTIHMVCVTKENKLVRLPAYVLEAVNRA